MKSLIFIFSMLFLFNISFAQDAKIATPEQVETAVDTAEQIGSDVTEQTKTPAIEIVEVQEEPTTFQKIISWLKDNWQIVTTTLFPLLWLIARLTPSEKDNDLLRIIQSWLDAIIPNLKKGGGSFAAYREKEKAPAMAYTKKKKDE